VGPACVGQFKVGAGNHAIIWIISTGVRIDLNGLLSRVNEVDIVDERIQRVAATRCHVNRMGSGPLNRQIGNGCPAEYALK